MKVKLQARQMWDAVKYGNVDHHEDRRALEDLLAAVLPEMAPVLADKLTTKESWEAITKARIGCDRARRSTLEKLRQEWDRLAFRSGEDIDNFALRLSSLMQQLKRFGDDDVNEERAVEKLLVVVPGKYTQVALASTLRSPGGGDAAGPLRAHDQGGDRPSQGCRQPQAITRRADHRGRQASTHREAVACSSG
jgi:hypothetical protein